MPSPNGTPLFDAEFLQFTPSLEEQYYPQPERSVQHHSQQSFDDRSITNINPQLLNDEHENINTLASIQWPSFTEFPCVGHQDLADTWLSKWPTWPTDGAACRLNRHNYLSRCLSRNTKAKRSLSKDEIELLETEFKRNSKPSAMTKRALAEQVNVHYARINVRRQIAQST